MTPLEHGSMTTLMTDPPVSYAEISGQFELPIGSIGPTRGRFLAKLRVLIQVSRGESLVLGAGLIRLLRQ